MDGAVQYCARCCFACLQHLAGLSWPTLQLMLVFCNSCLASASHYPIFMSVNSGVQRSWIQGGVGGEVEPKKLKFSYLGQRISAMCEWDPTPETLGEFNISNTNNSDTQMARL